MDHHGFSTSLQRTTWWIFTALALTILCHESRALDCFHCSSLNGTNPECELGASSKNRSTMISADCRTKIGAVTEEAAASGIEAVACVTMLGNYDVRGEHSYGLSRFCTAQLPPSEPQGVHCGKFDSDGVLNIEGKLVTGCSVACKDHECNGVSLMKLGQLMHKKFEEYVQELNKTDPTILSVLKMPKILAMADEQRRIEDAAIMALTTTPGSGVKLTNLSSLWLCLFSIMTMLLIF